MTLWDQFRYIWLVDFEFCQPDGHQPSPLCIVAREFRTGQLIRHWFHNSNQKYRLPYAVGVDSLMVAYYASAELSCHLALNWPLRRLYGGSQSVLALWSRPCETWLIGSEF